MNSRDKACPPQQQGRCRKKNSANSVTRAGNGDGKEKIEKPVECAGLRRFRDCEMAHVRQPTTCGKLRRRGRYRHFLARDATADETASL
jgi:hypothetical protein